ncbi:hypothetical protein ABB02_02059 [Clostridiaceae bacterium JG1575]|nr:hypothetical protein ABB02_02059 [Clostridiaceae bacterium JG1575]
MEFRPEKNNIAAIFFCIVLIVDILLLLLFDALDSAQIRVLLTLFLVFANVYAIYVVAFLWTLKFVFQKEELIISGAFDVKHIRIAREDLLSWSRKITLLDISGVPISSHRFAIGKGQDHHGERAELFITSSKKSVFLQTKNGNYGLSPADPDGFIEQLSAWGIPQRILHGNEGAHKLHSFTQEHLRSLIVYTCITICMQLFLPGLMHLLGFLPDWVAISPHSYLPRAHYMEAVLVRGLSLIGSIFLTYGLIQLLSFLEWRSRHRLMYLPLVFALFSLAMEISTLLNILLAG